MTTRFLNFFPWILQWEGETYENDPDDPGGATKFGIDQRSHPEVNIKKLTREQAAEIYFVSYWTKSKCEFLPVGVGEIVMNISVNCGPDRAAKWLQAAVGAVPDGLIGPKTILAANSQPIALTCELLFERLRQHYLSIAKGKLAKFLRGWLNRTESLKVYVASLFRK